MINKIRSWSTTFYAQGNSLHCIWWWCCRSGKDTKELFMYRWESMSILLPVTTGHLSMGQPYLHWTPNLIHTGSKDKADVHVDATSVTGIIEDAGKSLIKVETWALNMGPFVWWGNSNCSLTWPNLPTLSTPPTVAWYPLEFLFLALPQLFSVPSPIALPDVPFLHLCHHLPIITPFSSISISSSL